jgi:hypothetical protein
MFLACWCASIGVWRSAPVCASTRNHVALEELVVLSDCIVLPVRCVQVWRSNLTSWVTQAAGLILGGVVSNDTVAELGAAFSVITSGMQQACGVALPPRPTPVAVRARCASRPRNANVCVWVCTCVCVFVCSCVRACVCADCCVPLLYAGLYDDAPTRRLWRSNRAGGPSTSSRPRAR